MARKSSKVAVETVSEIVVADTAADAVASTLTGTRIALDASDPVYDPSYSPATPITVYDPTYEPATPHVIVPMGGTVEDIPVDPMAPYADRTVKMSYRFDGGYELPMNRLFKGSDASVEAANRANDPTGPKVSVVIYDATTDQELTTVYPVAGARSVRVVTGNRSTATTTRTVKAGMSEEERQRIEAEKQRKEEERQRKARETEEARQRKEEEKAQKARDKAAKEEAKRIAKALKKTAKHPETGTELYEYYLLFTREQGATCKEMNHYRNVRLGVTNSNGGWRQAADKLEAAYGLLLIGQGRQCEVSDKRGLSEAMRLIDRSEKVPANWINISKEFESTYVEQTEE